MTESFEREFLDKIKREIKEMLYDYMHIEFNVHVAEDISFYLNGSNEFRQNDLILILSSGNFSRTPIGTGGSNSIFNGSVSISFYCWLNFAKDVKTALNNYFDEISVLELTRTEEHLYACNFNTLIGDNIERIFSGENVKFFNVIGTVSYYKTKSASELKIPFVKIQQNDLDTEYPLINVVSFEGSSSSTTDDVNVMGERFIKRFENIDSVSYTVQVIIDPNDYLHSLLIRILHKFETKGFVSNKLKIKISQLINNEEYDTGFFNSFISVDTSYNIGNFTIYRITITR